MFEATLATSNSKVCSLNFFLFISWSLGFRALSFLWFVYPRAFLSFALSQSLTGASHSIHLDAWSLPSSHPAPNPYVSGKTQQWVHLQDSEVTQGFYKVVRTVAWNQSRQEAYVPDSAGVCKKTGAKDLKPYIQFTLSMRSRGIQQNPLHFADECFAEQWKRF